MSNIEIRALDDVLKNFANGLRSIGGVEGEKVLTRALKRTTSTIHGRVIRTVRKQSDIPTFIIRRQVKKKVASLEGVIWARGKPLSLKYFRAQQFSFGVRARHGGKWHEYPSAFMGPRPGVIAKRLGGHVFMRTTSGRLPIEKLFGPSVPEELVRSETERVFRETVEDVLARRVAHELARVLAKR